MASCAPDKILISVDLPEPFEPKMTVLEPVSKVCVTPCKMC